MKATFFVLMLSLLSTTVMAQSPRFYVLKPKYAFTPKGFDSNDNAQLTIAGAFSDYCMQIGPTQKRVDQANKKIYIKQTYTTTNNCNDIEMYIPYSLDINLGPLSPGEYEVYLFDLDQQYTLMSKLPIQAAKTRTADERVYAQVTGVDFKFANRAVPLLTIKGVFTNTCLTLGNIEVHQRMGDVFEVLPLAKVSQGNCKATVQPFSKTVELPGFTQRDTLIHVRSMNGQSINKVITTLDRIH